MINLEFKPFKVEVLRSIDSTEEAWTTSKPTIAYKSEDELKKTVKEMASQDLPLSAFKQYHLRIESSILFRDLLFTIRPCIAWSSSFRINPIRPGNIFLESIIEPLKDELVLFTEELKDAYKWFEEGRPLDEVKTLLPVATMTQYVVSIDSRTLMCIIATLYDMDKLGFAYHIMKLCNVLGYSDYGELPKTSANSLYNKLCTGDTTNYSFITPNKDFKISEYKEYSDYCAELTTITDLSTAGQALRQHFSLMRYQGFDVVKTLGYVGVLREFTCQDRLKCIAVGQVESFKQLICRRICHVVHWDSEYETSKIISWADILKPMISGISTKEFASLLPCKCNWKKCSVSEETRLRLWKNKGVAGTVPDANTVCPILVGDPSLVQKRKEFYNSNSCIMSKWEDLVAEGFIRKNETKWSAENEWDNQEDKKG